MEEDDEEFQDYLEWMPSADCDDEQLVSEPVAEYGASTKYDTVHQSKQLEVTDPPQVDSSFVERWLNRPFRFSGAGRDWAYYKKLGDDGEKQIIVYERQRLAKAGRSDLAARVVKAGGESASRYDILSFDEKGGPLYIEVKTTDEGSKHPFIVTEKQIAASAKLGERYLLYRIYNFRSAPEFYILKGPLSVSAQTKRKDHWGWPTSVSDD